MIVVENHWDVKHGCVSLNQDMLFKTLTFQAFRSFEIRRFLFRQIPKELGELLTSQQQ